MNFKWLVAFLLLMTGKAVLSQVVDGEETTDFPAVLKLTNESGYMTCTLQFLSDTTALTAAHCLGDLKYDDCKVDQDELRNHFNGRIRSLTCASYFRCDAGIEGPDGKIIEAKSCFVPKAYYIGRKMVDYLPFGQLVASGNPQALRNYFYRFAQYDIAVVVFPRGTAGKVGITEADFLKISTVKPALNMRVMMVGYGNNTGISQRDSGSGKKRRGSNEIAEIAYGTLKVNGKKRNKANNGTKVSVGKGDSGGALISQRAKDFRRIIGITSSNYDDIRGVGDDSAVSYFATVNSEYALRLFGHAKDCMHKEVVNSALGNCADDIVSLAK